MDGYQNIFEKLSPYLEQLTVAPNTKLLEQNKIAQKIYFIDKGCLRQYIVKNGVEITAQFFLEKTMVSSAESFRNNLPSQFVLESIEPTQLYYLDKRKFKELANQDLELKGEIEKHIFDQFIYYQQLFLSRITLTPQERYQELLTQQPDLIKRIAQKYLASYLGVTPVSLSRIRARR